MEEVSNFLNFIYFFCKTLHGSAVLHPEQHTTIHRCRKRGGGGGGGGGRGGQALPII